VNKEAASALSDAVNSGRSRTPVMHFADGHEYARCTAGVQPRPLNHAFCDVTWSESHARLLHNII